MFMVILLLNQKKKKIGNVINENFVSTADYLIKIRTQVACKYDGFSLGFEKNSLFSRIY